MIVITTPPSECFARLKSRNRPCEANVELDYLERLEEGHENLCAEIESWGWPLFKTGSSGRAFFRNVSKFVCKETDLFVEYELFCKKHNFKNLFKNK